MNGARNAELAVSGGWHGRDPFGSTSPVRIGRYVVLGSIGSGGSATVYLGRLLSEAGFSRTVAVKRLRSEYSSDPDFVAMFLDEARLVARIHHPNVVQALDVFWSDVDGGRELFMIMEYVAGETLSRVLAKYTGKQEPPPLGVALAISRDILRGLDAAHNAKSVQGQSLDLVHRDVSPQNVIVGVHGAARLLDFGIAKAAGRLHTTRVGDFKGKASYMAPEQVLGSATKLSDVYSASVVLWEAITGRRMFEGDSPGAILHKVATCQAVPPSAIVRGVPAAIDAIVMRGLSHNPDARFRSAHAMADAIEAATVVARPREVAAWLHGVAHQELRLRANQVSLLESVEASGVVRLGETPRDEAVPRRSGVTTRVERNQEKAPGPFLLQRGRMLVPLLIGLAVLAISVGTFAGRHWRSAVIAQATAPALNSIALPQAAIEQVKNVPGGETSPQQPMAHSPSEIGLPQAAIEQVKDVPGGETSPQQPMAHLAPSRTMEDGRSPKPSVHAPRTSPRRPRSAARAECDPPFVEDSAGKLHFKAQCF